MIKWEYTTYATPNMSDPAVTAMGEEGWELVTVVPMPVQRNALTQPQLMPVLFFKRPKPQLQLA